MEFELDRNDAIRLTDGTIIDKLLTPGNYYVPSTPAAKTMIGLPVPHPGRLTVLSLMNEVIMQDYLANEGGKVSRIWRLNNAGKFSEWYQAAEEKRFRKVVSFSDAQYPMGEGFVITDRFIYLCGIADNKHEAVYRFDKYTMKEKARITFDGLILHGNDMAWDGSRIMVAAGGGSKKVVCFDEYFQYQQTVPVPYAGITSLSGIAYDPVSGLTAIYGGSSHKVFIAGDITGEPYMEITHSGTANFQGIAFYDWVIYGIYSSGKVKALNIDGDEIGNWNIKIPGGEYEGMDVRDGRIYYNVMDHDTGVCTLYYSDLRTIIDHPFM